MTASPVVALDVHDGVARIGLLALVAAHAAVGIATGTIARAAVAFESLALIAWYLGPVNRVGPFDPAQLVRTLLAVLVIALAVPPAALSVAAYHAGARLDSARS